MGAFDFLLGHWRVERRSGLRPLGGEVDWDSFAAKQYAQKLPAGIGRFEANGEFDGRPIRARHIWTPIATNAARWELAFSPDDGATWEVNWIMEFTPEQP